MSDNAKHLYDNIMDMIKDNKDHKWDVAIKQSLDMLEMLVSMAGDEREEDYDTAIKLARQALED